MSPAGDISAPVIDEELALLLDVFRLSRVTLAYADPGTAAHEYVRRRLMPLLEDVAPDARPTVAILFDDWHGDPLSALSCAIAEGAAARCAAGSLPNPSGSLPQTLLEWQERLDVAFIVVFDRLDAYLQAPVCERVAQFEAELIESITAPRLRANFVFLVPDDDAPLLERFLGRIPELGEASVRLPRAASGIARAAAAEYVSTVERSERYSRGIHPPDAVDAELDEHRRERTSAAVLAAREPAPAEPPMGDTLPTEQGASRDAGPRRRHWLREARLHAALGAFALAALAGIVYIAVNLDAGGSAPASVAAHDPRDGSVKTVASTPRQERGPDTALIAPDPPPAQGATSDAPPAEPLPPEAVPSVASPAAPPPARIAAQRTTRASNEPSTRGKSTPVLGAAGEAPQPAAAQDRPKPPPPHLRSPRGAEQPAMPAASARTAAVPTPKPTPQRATIDAAFTQRAADECRPGAAGILCRESIRLELCQGRWSPSPANGRTLCHMSEAAVPLSD